MIALFGPIKAEVLESEFPYLKVKPQRKLSRVPQIVTAKVGDRSFRLKVKPVDRDCDATWVEVSDFFGAQPELEKALAELRDRRLIDRERATQVDNDYRIDVRVLSVN